MRGKKLGLSVVLVLLLTVLIEVDEAWSQAAQFQVCNSSRKKASVAIARRVGINDSRFLLSGWFNYDPGECRLTNIYIPWGTFYTYAEGSDGTRWTANDNRFCISEQAFERIVDLSTPGCPPGLYIVPFKAWTAEGGTGTWTLNLY